MYYDGDWDQALAQIADLIAEIEGGGLTSFMESANLSVRARIRVARGDVAGAVEDAERSLDRRPDREEPPGAAPGAGRPGRRPGGDRQPGRSLRTGRRALRELAGTSDSGVRLLADRGRLRARSARARRRTRRGARADQGPLAVGRGRTRIRFRGALSGSRHPRRGSEASRTRPTRVYGRATRRMCAGRSSSTAPSARLVTWTRASRCCATSRSA